jgi:hypothetical protein
LIQIKARFAGSRKTLRRILPGGERRSVSYKDLLLVLDSEANARERIDFACALAERFSAHLIGLFRLPTPEAPRHSAITTRRCSILCS